MVRRSIWLVRGCAGLGAKRNAQTVAELSGRVPTIPGGALPGVAVTADTDRHGLDPFGDNECARASYVFASLPVGPYKLAARLDGFSAFEQTRHRAGRRRIARRSTSRCRSAR